MALIEYRCHWPGAAGLFRSLGNLCSWCLDIIECWINLGEEGFSPVHQPSYCEVLANSPRNVSISRIKNHNPPGTRCWEPGMKSNPRSKLRVTVIISILDGIYLISQAASVSFSSFTLSMMFSASSPSLLISRWSGWNSLSSLQSQSLASKKWEHLSNLFYSCLFIKEQDQHRDIEQ